MNLQSPELKEVGLSLLWPVVSFWTHWCDQYLCHQTTNIDSLTLLVPIHQTFHPVSNRDTPENVLRTAQSFLFTQPRGASTLCCWAVSRQFTLCGTSSASFLSGVCSSRVVGVEPGLLSLP